MKVLVTGATGFVGRNLIPKLIKEKFEVLEITINSEKSKDIYGETIQRFAFNYQHQAALIEAVRKFDPEVVVHLASYLNSSDSYSDLITLLDANVYYLCHILDAIKQCRIKLFINTGSSAEYYKGNGELDPAYLYAATKTSSRIFVDYYSKAYNFSYITIVPYTIYGGIDSKKKIIDLIYDSLGSDIPINLTEGNQILDFIHIDDITDFYLTVLLQSTKVPNKTTFHLGTGVGHTLREIASIMEISAKKKSNINWGGNSYRPRDLMYSVANISNQFQLFNWRPKIKLEDGIKKYLVEREPRIQ